MRAKGFAHFVNIARLEGLDGAPAAEARGAHEAGRLARAGAKGVW
jgi:hypothetical protein